MGMCRFLLKVNISKYITGLHNLSLFFNIWVLEECIYVLYLHFNHVQTQDENFLLKVNTRLLLFVVQAEEVVLVAIKAVADHHICWLSLCGF